MDERIKKLFALTSSENDSEAISALSQIQKICAEKNIYYPSLLDANARPIDAKENLSDRVKARIKELEDELAFVKESWNNALDKNRELVRYYSEQDQRNARIERESIQLSNENSSLREIILNDMSPEYFTSFGVKRFISVHRLCGTNDNEDWVSSEVLYQEFLTEYEEYLNIKNSKEFKCSLNRFSREFSKQMGVEAVKGGKTKDRKGFLIRRREYEIKTSDSSGLGEHPLKDFMAENLR